MTKNHFVNKIYGCLMGVACGDAMGMPTSMMNPHLIRKSFPDGIKGFEAAPSKHPIHAGMVAGQVTDDTQQTLLLATAILEDGKVVPEGWARRLLKWAEDMNAFGSLLLGPSSLKALQAIQAGRSIEKSGVFGDTNGACMRIAPVGIIHLGDIDRTVADVALSCLPTHNTDIAIAGASAVACAIGACVSGNQSVDHVIEVGMEGASRGMAKGFPWIGASVIRRTELALKIVSESMSERQMLQDLYDYVGAGVAMAETVPVSFSLFKYSNGDPVRAIRLAANLGGDADTIGAVTGSIAGAYAGIEAFPKDYVQQIEDVNKLNLKDYAHRLAEFGIKHAGLPLATEWKLKTVKGER